jgi:SAM-dependent methyltransferase
MPRGADSDSDATLNEQIAYYRARATEYDATLVGDVEALSQRFADLLQDLDPRGEVLEIACGTGLWTQHLVRMADSLTALDSSPEMIELARSRIGAPEACLVVADVFAWEPDRRYDCIFFGFWLSHVPPARFGDFWRRLAAWLARGGRVLFVDEGRPRAAKDPSFRSAEGPLVKRRLRDGTAYDIVKVFYDSDEVTGALADLGWAASIRLSEDGFLVGTARR